jgi:mono/diheme cytochrome c family protein
VRCTRADGGRDGPGLCVATARASDCGVAATATVQAGTRYRLSGWIRTVDVAPVRGSDGAMLNVHGGVRTRGVRGTSDWTEVAVEFEADETRQIVVHCLFGGYGGASGTAWFDDVALVAIGSGNTLAGALEALAAAQRPEGAAPAPRVRTFAIDDAVHTRGSAVYARTCIACHGIDGKGTPKGYPPLDGSDRLTGPAQLPIDIVLHGLYGRIRVGDATFDNVMTPLGMVLTDAEIADVLTYVRQRWSNDTAPVTCELVAARRAANRERTGLWTAGELGR